MKEITLSNVDEEIEKYQKEAEKLQNASHQCIGIVKYLSNKKQELMKDKKKDK